MPPSVKLLRFDSVRSYDFWVCPDRVVSVSPHPAYSEGVACILVYDTPRELDRVMDVRGSAKEIIRALLKVDFDALGLPPS